MSYLIKAIDNHQKHVDSLMEDVIYSKRVLGFIRHDKVNEVELITVFGLPVFKRVGDVHWILGFTFSV